MTDRSEPIPGGQSVSVPGITDVARLESNSYYEVYRGHETATGRSVAVKVLPRALDRGGRALFDRERTRLARLKHIPTILQLDAVDTLADGRPYLISELCAESLDDRLRAEGPLPADEVLDIGRDLADALTRAHEIDLVHGAVTPANVLFRRSGEVVLADFGTALRQAFGEDHLGASSSAAPETLRDGVLSAEADLYGLGAILYTALVGRPPFPARAGENPNERILRAMSEPAPDVDAGIAGPELADLVADLLNTDPEDRPVDAAEVLARLERCELLPAPGRRAASIPAVAVLPPTPVAPRAAAPDPDATDAQSDSGIRPQRVHPDEDAPGAEAAPSDRAVSAPPPSEAASALPERPMQNRSTPTRAVRTVIPGVIAGPGSAPPPLAPADRTTGDGSDDVPAPADATPPDDDSPGRSDVAHTPEDSDAPDTPDAPANRTFTRRSGTRWTTAPWGSEPTPAHAQVQSPPPRRSSPVWGTQTSAPIASPDPHDDERAERTSRADPRRGRHAADDGPPDHDSVPGTDDDDISRTTPDDETFDDTSDGTFDRASDDTADGTADDTADGTAVDDEYGPRYAEPTFAEPLSGTPEPRRQQASYDDARSEPAAAYNTSTRGRSGPGGSDLRLAPESSTDWSGLLDDVLGDDTPRKATREDEQSAAAPSVSGRLIDRPLDAPSWSPAARRTAALAALVVGIIVLMVVANLSLKAGGHDDRASAPSTAPTSAATTGPSLAVRLVAVQDRGTFVQVTWSGAAELLYNVVVAKSGETKARVVPVQHARELRISVAREVPYCFQIQATDGTNVVETKPRAIRGGVCSNP